MPTTAKKPKTTTTEPVVVSTGCPSGIGPEISLRAALRRGAGPIVLIGDRATLRRAGQRAGLEERDVERALAGRLLDDGTLEGRLAFVQEGESLTHRQSRPGHPSPEGGAAQLAYVETGYRLARHQGWPLVTAPVSKEAIARSGSVRARKFRGHTEWLEQLDGAPYSVMCFASPKLVAALVTTHLPLSRVSRQLTPSKIRRVTGELADLVLRLSGGRPRLAVCSFNPHAGEGGLLGREEERAILPGVVAAREVLGRRAVVDGPIGAETAFRRGAAGGYDGIVAIYHDQATIPMKLIDFGGAVNVTQGLSIVRTSVDHGTAYDIAGEGIADCSAMTAAIGVARRLGAARRRIPRGEQ